MDPYNTSLDKALSNFHIAHRAVSSAVQEVPFGRGRRFGGSSHGVVDAIAGGWRVSAFLVLATGNPLTVFGGPAANINNPGTFGVIGGQANSPRLIQFAVKLIF